MNNEFRVHMLDEAGKRLAAEIAQAFDELLVKLDAINSVSSREMAICRTKLEEACFFAKKAMASRMCVKSPGNE